MEKLNLNKLNELIEFCKNRKFLYISDLTSDFIETIPYYKKGSKIKIKKENKGKFTEYCNGKVTSECIAKGKKSKSLVIRKRATFAANSRRWKHQQGGIFINQQSNLLNRLLNFNKNELL